MELIFFLVPTVVALAFAWAFLTLVYRIFTGLVEWTRNNGLAVERVPARVVARRTDIRGMTSRRPHGSIQTCYFATFEGRTGERAEFAVPGPEYGLLVEGDEGVLNHQGTRYLGFQRSLAKTAVDQDF